LQENFGSSGYFPGIDRTRIFLCGRCVSVFQRSFPGKPPLFPDLVNHQFILVANEEISIDDDRMRPTLSVVGSEFEFPKQSIFFGVGIDHGHDAILVSEKEFLVG